MVSGRRRFNRATAVRSYRKLFVIAAEGAKTEPEYFALFNSQGSVIRVSCLKGRHDSSPPQVLKRMERHLQKEGLRASDEAWLVVDKDQWNDSQLSQLYSWSKTEANFGFALSNPKFEYWLLLHFEDGSGLKTPRECSDRLSRFITDYSKGISANKFTADQISSAIERARKRDNPPCLDWPRSFAGTTVYKLVERLILASE